MDPLPCVFPPLVRLPRFTAWRRAARWLRIGGGEAELNDAKLMWVGRPSVPDFACAQCHAPAGLLVQHGGFILRCSQCGCPGPCSLLSMVADQLHSRYKAVLLSRDSEEIAVVAEGIGTDIVPLVLDAAANGQFVWMKPIDSAIRGT